jgi:hypothetical protein
VVTARLIPLAKTALRFIVSEMITALPKPQTSRAAGMANIR